jgi:predicted P-loop ATPase
VNQPIEKSREIIFPEIDPSTSKLDQALALFHAGLHLILNHSPKFANELEPRLIGCSCGNPGCQSAGKHPVVTAWQKSIFRDESQVRAGLERKPEANLGVVGGRQRNGAYLAIIDVDDLERLKKIEAAVGELPETVTTRSGRGLHYFYAVPKGIDVTRFKNVTGLRLEGEEKPVSGVDFKGENGQVVLPPSIHSSGAVYKWLSVGPATVLPLEWCLFLLPIERTVPTWAHRHNPVTLRSDPNAERRHRRYFEAALRGEAAVVAQTGKGLRNTTLYRSLCSILALANGMSLVFAQEDAIRHLSEAAQAAGLHRREIEASVKSAEKWTKENNIARATPFSAFEPESGTAPSLQAPSTPPGPIPSSVGWEAGLLWSGGKLEKNLKNTQLILQNESIWSGKVSFDEFAERIVIESSCPANLPYEKSFPLPWTDVHTTRTAEWLQASRHRLNVGLDVVATAVHHFALTKRFHPLRDRLGALQWDGKSRLDTWLTDYLGVASTKYTDLVGAKWVISAVARVMRPGCKADHVLILEGAQGKRKSSAVYALSYGFFTDELAGLGSKDCAMQLHGAWIIELSELDALAKAEVSKQKAFTSKTFDRYRAPYGRVVVDHPRQCVFVGTVNKDEYLLDETGGRRWWPVRCEGTIDVTGLIRDRDQLWAEAVARFNNSENWWLDGEDEALAKKEQSERFQSDSDDQAVLQFISKLDQVSVRDICINCFGIPESGKHDQRMQNRAAKILVKLGWEKRRVRDGSRIFWAYLPNNS